MNVAGALQGIRSAGIPQDHASKAQSRLDNEAAKPVTGGVEAAASRREPVERSKVDDAQDATAAARQVHHDAAAELQRLEQFDVEHMTASQRQRHLERLTTARERVGATQLDYQDAVHQELSVARDALSQSEFKLYAERLEQRELAAAKAADPSDVVAAIAAKLTATATVKAAADLESAEATVADLERQVSALPASYQHYLQPSLDAARVRLEDLRLADHQKRFDAAVALTDATQDPKEMDRADTFRRSLTPDEQKIYDDNLEALRNDDRINFVSVDGREISLAERELALRGILAASYGTPGLREQAIKDAVGEGNGKFDIYFEPGGFKPSSYGYGKPSTGTEGDAAGLFTPDSDLVIDRTFLMSASRQNDNPFVHEFAHALQSAGKDGKVLPSTFDEKEQEAFQAAFESVGFQALLQQLGLSSDWGGEAFPAVENLFRQRPELVQRASPELYALMVSNMGIDPIAGRQT